MVVSMETYVCDSNSCGGRILICLFRRPAFVVCRTDEVAGIMNSHELEILTLATLSSLKVCCEDFCRIYF